MRYNKCPRCGGETRCLAGHSAHGHNWFCANETGCGWQAWNQSATLSPTKDPSDEDSREIKRLQAAWDSAFKQAMENGSKYQQAMTALKVAREALEEAIGHLEWIGYGDSYERGCANESKLPGKLDNAIRKIKELMGEK